MDVKARFISILVIALSVSAAGYQGVASGTIRLERGVEGVCPRQAAEAPRGQKLQVRFNNHYWIWVRCHTAT